MSRTIDGMKINEFAQYVFKDAYQKGLITPIMIFFLQSRSYSKKVFNSRYPILREKTKSVNLDKYSKQTVVLERYYLLTQWEEKQWDKLILWLRSIKYKKPL